MKPLSFNMPCKRATYTCKASALVHKRLTKCGRRHLNSCKKTTCSPRLSLMQQKPISMLRGTFNCLHQKLPRRSDQKLRQFQVRVWLAAHYESLESNKRRSLIKSSESSKAIDADLGLRHLKQRRHTKRAIFVGRFALLLAGPNDIFN